MDEFQHYERFDMENEFEDGRFENGEFLHKGKKDKRKQTAEDVIYGVFNESDSDEEGGSKRRRRDGVIKKANYQKPVNFMSAGTVQPSEELEKEQEAQGRLQQDDNEFEERGGLGSESRAGLGSTQDDLMEERQEEDNPVLRKIKEDANKRREREKQEKEKEKVDKKAANTKHNLGLFEKNTKGIGMKLLEKMGYKGGGLGKQGQGRVTPVESVLRRKQIGLGFDGQEAAAVDADKKAEEEAVKIEKPKQQLWKKQFYPKVKKVHKTAAEVLAESESKNIGTTTILDMRGPQVRVLTNLERINEEAALREDDTPMPELQHNLRLIVDLAETEIQICDRKLRQERDSIAVLYKDRDRLQADARKHAEQVQMLEAIVAAAEGVAECHVDASLDVLASAFESMRARFGEEYLIYGLSALALSYALPTMVQMFRSWDPLTQSTHGLVEMRRWQALLLNPDEARNIFVQDMESDTDPYSILIREAVLPPLRMMVCNSWEPRDPEPMVRFMELWEDLLPPSIKKNILDQLVMPKLTAAVNAWDPRRETVPIHEWLHPWLPMLGNSMEPLYSPIRFKMGSALHAWHASDASAYILLSPWQRVFDPASWEALLVRCILPKLMFAMQELTINPHQQVLDQFNWVMRWVGAMPTHHMVALLETAFFPKWQQVLYHWLCAGPNYSEVERWYRGWSALLPAELHASERVRLQLNAALDMMNQALEGAPVVEPGARENLSYLRVTEQRQFESQQQQQQHQQQQQPPPASASTLPSVSALHSDSPMSLKEVVEAFAAQSEVPFLPKVGRMHEGLQVYGFGTVSIVIDSAKQSLAAQVADRWTPVSLEQLLEMHNARLPGTRWK